MLIVMHNVTHTLSPFTENEFSFDYEQFLYFIENFSTAPLTAFFSYYGWIGVSFFVFISGYGLTVKYGDKKINYLCWISKHYIKLFVLLLVPLLLYICLRIISKGSDASYLYFIPQQLLILNIYPSKITPQIYWYIGMAFQLYVWFLLIRKMSTSKLLFIGAVILVLLAVAPSRIVSYLRHNSIGWLHDFIFGIICAKGLSFKKINRYLSGVGLLVMLLLLSSSGKTFVISELSFIALLLLLRKLVSKVSLFVYIGEISAAIYVIHPIMRSIVFNKIGDFSVLEIPLLTATIVLSASIVISAFYSKLYKHILEKTTKHLESRVC